MSSYLIVAVLWAVAIWRAPTAWQQPWKRAPWMTIFMVAVALTADLPPVITAIDHSTGIADLATLIKLLAGVTAAIAAVNGVIAANMPGHAPRLTWRWLIPWGIAMTALVTVFVLMPRREVPDFTASVTGGLPAVFLLIWYVSLGAAVVATAVLYLRASRVRTAPSARAGMWLVTAACAVGMAFVGWMLAYLALRTMGAALPGGVTGYLSLADALEAISLLLLIAGMSIPALAVGACGARDLLDLRALRALWSDVTTAVPEVRAGPWPRGIAGIRDPHVRLIRRVAEIRDASIHLRRYVPCEVVSAARIRLSGRCTSARELQAAAEATWIGLAIRARHDGDPPVQDPHVLPGRASLREETAWLRDVAAARKTRDVHDVMEAAARYQATSGR
jgi:hypothetical protein